jgi:tetratricopeptide (TPR) repeat protein
VSYAHTLRAHASTPADDLPWDVTQSLRQRVGALPEPAQELLQVAAVVGRTVPHRLLVTVAGLDEESVLAALDAASRAGLLVENGRREHRFLHDVIREVIEADLGAARRGVLHHRVGTALEQLSGTAVELAWHFLEGHEPERALPYMVMAGDQAETVFAHEEAEQQYQAALDLMRATQKLELEASTLDKLGTVQITAGRYDEALLTLEESLRIYGMALDLEGERRAAAHIAWAHMIRGTSRDGLERVRPLLERLDTGDASPGLADLCIQWARLQWDIGNFGESLAAAERASELAQVLHDDGVLSWANYWRGLTLWQMGRLDDELQTWNELGEILQAIPTSDGGGDNLSDAVPAVVRLSRGELRESRQQLERELQLARTRHDPAMIAQSLSLLGFCAVMMSEWSDARALIEDALEISQSLGSSLLIAPLMDLGLLSLFQGDYATASRYLHEAAEQADRKGELFTQRITAERLARLDLLEGQPECAIERLLPLLDRNGLEEFRVAVLLSTLAWAYLEMGDAGRAETLVADAVQREAAQHSRVDLAYALSVQAKVLMYLTRWNEAEQCLQQALVLYGSTPAPYHVALTLHDFGLLHAKRGELAMAREQLLEASAVFARLGAKVDLERTKGALDALPRQG